MFALLARMCGVPEVFIGAEQYQTARAPENDAERRRYIHVIMQYLTADVVQMNLYGEHMFGFYRGCNRYVTGRSHSSEGGWIRDALAKATYPRPRGLVSTSMHSVGAFPRFKLKSTNQQAFTRDIISHMLECSAMIADADPASVHNLTSVMLNRHFSSEGELEEGVVDNNHQRPDAFPDLKDVVDIVENHAVMMLTRTDLDGATEGHTPLLARNTFRKYFNDNSVDVHLGRAEILPYAFVENGAVLKHPSSVKSDGPRAGREVELPLLPGGVIISERYSSKVSSNGRHLAPKVYSRFRDYGLRQMGAFYIGSGPFGGDDFTRMRLVPNAHTPPEPILCNANRDTLAGMHWMRPHCPVPMPGECSQWHGRAMIEFQTSRNSQLRTGFDEPVVLTVSEPVARCVRRLERGEVTIRRNVNRAYRTILNLNDLSDDEEIQMELFEAMDDHLPPRLADGRDGFIGMAGAPPEGETDHGGGPDIGAPRAPPPPREERSALGADTPEDAEAAEEGAGEAG
jgi:hypothetical protein